MTTTGPLLTLREHELLLAARESGAQRGSQPHGAPLAASDQGAVIVECSMDLGRTIDTVQAKTAGWTWRGQRYPYLEECRDRTVYYWDGASFAPVARYTSGLVKLVPTEWGAPTFEIDGIKMLPTAQVSPYEDAGRKVALIEPRGKVVLDTCGGLGYFAAWCLAGGARRVLSYERNPDVLWLRGLNPWSPGPEPRLQVTEGDIATEIAGLADSSVDAVLHDPPRFAIAGELYSQAFYDQVARVLKRRGRLFHYTGEPNARSRGRDLPGEAIARLRRAGFEARRELDGVLAVRS